MFASRKFLIALLAALAATAARADVTLSGFLDDPGNTALVWSDLGTPLFDNDNDIANNVAIYNLSVATPGSVEFLSQGFALGGVDPYFTLFSGTGNTATFLGSNYTQAFSTGGDFDLSFSLAAGDYTLAIGAFANMSFAENLGAGTLGDGFIQLGGPGSLGTSYYQLQITNATNSTVPEPSLITPLLFGILAALLIKRDRSGVREHAPQSQAPASRAIAR